MKKCRTIIALLLILTTVISLSLCFSSCADKEAPESGTDSESEKGAATIDGDVSFQTIEPETETESETVPPETTEEVPYVPEPEPNPEPPYTPTPQPEPEPEPVPEPQPEPQPQPTPAPYDGSAGGSLFIGDSRTDGLRLTGALPGADIFCSVGLSVFGATSSVITVEGVGDVTLAQLLSMRSYSKIYILLGINEIGYDHDTLATKFSQLISFIQGYQPGAKIILQANLHVTTSRSSTDAVFNNANINSLNSKLQALTNGSTIIWLDANQLLDDASGGLNETYSGGDGIHLTWNCYTMWGQWILSQTAGY